MRTFHWTTAGAGLVFICPSIPSLFDSLVGRLMDKKGTRVLATAACTWCAICLILLRLVREDSIGNVVGLAVLLVLIGSSTPVLQVASMAEIGLTAHDLEELDTFAGKGLTGQAYGLFGMAFAIGQCIGPILAGFVSVKMGWAGMTLVLEFCVFSWWCRWRYSR